MSDYSGSFRKYLKHISFYVLVKLRSGDTLMSMLKEDNEDDVLLYFPVVVKSFSVVSDDGIGEAQSIMPWIGVDSEKLFYIQKSDIMIIKPLSARFIPMYINILKKYEFPEAYAKEQEKNAPKTKEMERQPQTEEVNDVISQLEQYFGLKEVDEDPEPKKIDGNDTSKSDNPTSNLDTNPSSDNKNEGTDPSKNGN